MGPEHLVTLVVALIGGSFRLWRHYCPDPKRFRAKQRLKNIRYEVLATNDRNTLHTLREQVAAIMKADPNNAEAICLHEQIDLALRRITINHSALQSLIEAITLTPRRRVTTMFGVAVIAMFIIIRRLT